MTQFNVPTKDNAPEGSKEIFAQLEKKLGKVPNLYATIGYSAETLGAYLRFSKDIETGFSSREVQAVYLAVSEANGCSYCLAAHTMLGKMNGFDDAQILALRRAHSDDLKLRALTRLAVNIVETRGNVDTALLEAFLSAGFDQKAFIDLTALVAAKSFSNYIHNALDFEIDFPAAPVLQEAVV